MIEKLLPSRHSTRNEPRLPSPISSAATICIARLRCATGSCRMPTPRKVPTKPKMRGSTPLDLATGLSRTTSR